MPDIDVKVHIDMSGLEKFIALIDKGLRQKQGPIRDAIRQWGRIYLGFIQERWDKYSRGGGDWSPLAQSTIERRRHRISSEGTKGIRVKRGKKAYAKSLSLGFGQVSILRDTDDLFAAVDPRLGSPPGAFREQISYGMIAGFGGSAKHRVWRKKKWVKGKATIADIAAAHQFGRPPHLPARPILVKPDARTGDRMKDAMIAAIHQAVAASQVRSA